MIAELGSNPNPLRFQGSAADAAPCRHAAAFTDSPVPSSPWADDSSLLVMLLDVSPASLSCLSSMPGLGLQSLLEQVTLAALPVWAAAAHT